MGAAIVQVSARPLGSPSGELARSPSGPPRGTPVAWGKGGAALYSSLAACGEGRPTTRAPTRLKGGNGGWQLTSLSPFCLALLGTSPQGEARGPAMDRPQGEAGGAGSRPSPQGEPRGLAIIDNNAPAGTAGALVYINIRHYAPFYPSPVRPRGGGSGGAATPRDGPSHVHVGGRCSAGAGGCTARRPAAKTGPRPPRPPGRRSRPP